MSMSERIKGFLWVAALLVLSVLGIGCRVHLWRTGGSLLTWDLLFSVLELVGAGLLLYVLRALIQLTPQGDPMTDPDSAQTRQPVEPKKEDAK